MYARGSVDVGVSCVNKCTYISHVPLKVSQIFLVLYFVIFSIFIFILYLFIFSFILPPRLWVLVTVLEGVKYIIITIIITESLLMTARLYVCSLSLPRLEPVWSLFLG